MPLAELPIEPGTMVPELLKHYPQARRVLNQYGLHGCGGAHGPAESLQFFARAHEVDESSLLAELKQAAKTSPNPLTISTDGPPQIDDTIYRRFFLAAIAVVLTAGGTWGTWLLWRIGIAHNFIGISLFDIDAHGHAQIFGWVGLFIMGFAYQAFPRFWRTRLVKPNLAVAVFAAMVIGIIIKTIALAATGTSYAATAAAAGGTLELAAILIFAWQIETTFMRSPAVMEPWIAFVFASLIFFVAQAAMDIWHAWMIMTAATPQQLIWSVSTYQSPLRDLQIHGMALLMIVGVCLRMVPALYVVPKIPPRRAWVALAILCTAVVAEAALFITYRWTDNTLAAALLLVPWTMLIVGVAIIALPWKLWLPLRDIENHTDRTGKFIRAAYAWLLVSLLMLLLLPLYQHLDGPGFSHAYYGSARHAIAVGFISLMIMGFAAKVVPTLNGIDPRTLSKLWIPFILINIGCLARVCIQTLTDSHPKLFPFVGISGVLELIAITWWAIELIQVLHRGRRGTEFPAPSCPTPAPTLIAANHRVADVLHWFPTSEAIFIHHGFAGICNPILRRTVARQVSISQAAAMHGVPLEPLLAELNGAVSKSGYCCNCK